MKKLTFVLIFIFTFTTVFLNAVYAEEVTITTYYPAPEGVYKKLGVGIKTPSPDSSDIPLEVQGGGTGLTDTVLRLSSESDSNQVLEMGTGFSGPDTRWIQAYKLEDPNPGRNLLLNPYPGSKVGIGSATFSQNAKLDVLAPNNMVPMAVRQATISPTPSFIDFYTVPSGRSSVGLIGLSNTGNVETFGFDAKSPYNVGLQIDNMTHLFIKGGAGNDLGNVGIGTVEPTNRLTVVGEQNINAATGIAGQNPGVFLYEFNYSPLPTMGLVRMELGNVTRQDGDYITGSKRGDTVLKTINAPTIEGGSVIFATESVPPGTTTERMRIGRNGNVGIGTTTPDEKLEVEWAPNVDVEIGRGTADLDVTFIALRSPDGRKRYITVTDLGAVTSSTSHP